MAFEYSEFLDTIHMLEFLDTIQMLDRSPRPAGPSRRRKIYKKRSNPLVELDENDFRKQYRFSKNNMKKLIAIVRKDLEKNCRGGHIPADLQVMVAIWYWGCNEKQDEAAHIHGISQPALSVAVSRVAKAFASRSTQLVTFPQSTLEQTKTIQEFKDYSEFPDVIGAIGCSYVKIPGQGAENGELYTNSKGCSSLNLQVICDANFKIRDLVCDRPGSAEDQSIYEGSSIKERLENGEFVGRLVGNGGYTCTDYLFTPFENPSNSSEEKYNMAQIAACNAIDRTFAIWKTRFPILLSGMRGSLDNIKTSILALAVLHNLAIEYHDELDEVVPMHAANSKTMPVAKRRRIEEEDKSRRSFVSTHFA